MISNSREQIDTKLSSGYAWTKWHFRYKMITNVSREKWHMASSRPCSTKFLQCSLYSWHTAICLYIVMWFLHYATVNTNKQSYRIVSSVMTTWKRTFISAGNYAYENTMTLQWNRTEHMKHTHYEYKDMMTNSEVINNIMCLVYRTFISNKYNDLCRITCNACTS